MCAVLVAGENKIQPARWVVLLSVLVLFSLHQIMAMPRAFVDSSINTYVTERLCWSSESCKVEFQAAFTCRCPEWSYCQSPGRYYNAYCSIVKSGYIWSQNFTHPKPTDLSKT